MTKPRKPHNDGSPKYSVGYRNTPVGTRFKPGQVANPNGRRGKKAKSPNNEPVDNVPAMLNAKLQTKVDLKIGGVTHNLTKLDVILERLIQDAMTGNLKARQIALDHLLKYREIFAAEEAKRPIQIKMIECVVIDPTLLPPVPGDQLRRWEEEHGLIIPKAVLDLMRPYLRPRNEVYADQQENGWPDEYITDHHR